MGITCQNQQTISAVSILMCGHLVKISNQRVGYSTVDIQIDSNIFPGVGKIASHQGNEIWTLQLVSKNDGARTAVLKFTISDDPCLSAPSCPNICVGNDLWSQKCSPTYDSNSIPIGFDCVQDSLIKANHCSCAGCPADYCVGSDLYRYTCDQTTGNCTGAIFRQGGCVTGKGNISFDSDPQGAEIWLGLSPGALVQDKGVKTPYSFYDITPGTYNYTLKRFNYENYIGTVDVVANQLVSVLSPMTPLPDSVYQFTVGLSSLTSASYVISTINRFVDLLNTWVLTKISGTILSSTTYDQTNHQVVFEIENVPTLGIGKNVKSLIAPILIIVIVLAVLPFILALAGWIKDKIWGGPKVVTPTQSSLQITARILSNEVPVVPIKDVTIEVAGRTFVANAGNGYIITIDNLDIGKTYPVKAYIPLSAGSNVNEASFEGTKTIESLTMNTMPVALKIDTLQQRDWKLCNLKLDGNPMPTGTIIRVFRMKTLADGTPILDTFGTTTSGADQCTGVVKVPAYISDSQILTQFISASVDPTQPSPTLHPGDQNDISTISKEKNVLTIITGTVLNNNIVADKIEITDKTTGTIIKSIVPTIYTTSITEIPKGTYTISVTKSGYKMSGCSMVPCEFTFTTDYLGSTTVTIVLESLVKTCKLDITVLDTYNKPPKTETYISIDSGTETIAPAGILSIPEIIAGDHKFTVRAEGYKKIDNVTKTVSCQTTTEAITFTLEQTGEIVSGSMIMVVNDLKGSVKVDKNKSFAINVTGGDATKEIQIFNITETPDLLIATIPAGQTDTTLSYDTDLNIQLQAFQGCTCTSLGCTLCSSNSNVIALTVGTGSPTCLIPGPFGTCLVKTSTGQSILMIGGLIVGGYIAFKIISSRPKVKEVVTATRAAIAEISPPEETARRSNIGTAV